MTFVPDLTLLLVRHGESEANRAGLFLGRTDSPLSARGRVQVQQLAQALKATPIRAIYSSPLKRAVDTASALGEASLDERLIEQDYGRWDGLRPEQAKTRFPKAFASWWGGDPDYAPPGGESLRHVAERMMALFDDLRATYGRGEIIALVGHGAALQSLLCTLLETPLNNIWPFRLQPATVTRCGIFGRRASMDVMSSLSLPGSG